MNKKGFTLIELLAVILILAVLTSIIVPIVTTQLKKSKEAALIAQTKMIEKAAADWALKNTDQLDEYHLNKTYVKISTLQSENFLEKGSIKNPVTKKKINDYCVAIKYNKASNSSNDQVNNYTYTYEEKECTEGMSENKISAYQTIADNVATVSSGTGLYEDESNYFYKGSDPNNYLKIDSDIYRIVSINKDTKMLKLMKNIGESKNWSSKVVFRDSTIDDYLNDEVYTKLEAYKSSINKNSTWNVGTVNNTSSYMVIDEAEQTATYNINLGLISISDYIKASSDNTCQNDLAQCKYNNYLNKGVKTWLINNSDTGIYYINTDGKIALETSPSSALCYVYPTFNLKINTVVTGTGTQADPYVVSE